MQNGYFKFPNKQNSENKKQIPFNFEKYLKRINAQKKKTRRKLRNNTTFTKKRRRKILAEIEEEVAILNKGLPPNTNKKFEQN